MLCSHPCKEQFSERPGPGLAVSAPAGSIFLWPRCPEEKLLRNSKVGTQAVRDCIALTEEHSLVSSSLPPYHRPFPLSVVSPDAHRPRAVGACSLSSCRGGRAPSP